VYVGSQFVHMTTDQGQSWKIISPDLTRNDKSRMGFSGGLTGDNIGVEYAGVVFALAESPVQAGVLWAGTNDGFVQVTRDGGQHWANVTANIPGMPEWGTVSSIEASHFDAGTAYVAADFHLVDNRDPYVYKTADFGKTWTRISSNLPKGPLAYVRAVGESPNKKGLLFAGTGNAFYYSLDDGAKWTQLQTGLPAAPVTWIAPQKTFHDVVISTYGRGLYVLDDTTPLEQMAASSGTRLFEPRPTYRFSRGGRAIINYWLDAPAKEAPQIEILDAHNEVIRTLRGANRQGLIRASWDLRYSPPRLIALRTTPPENPHIWEEPRFANQKTRPVTHWGTAQAEVGPMAAPGLYTVRLRVDGTNYTQPLILVQDPQASASNADLAASVKLQLRIRDDISTAADLVNEMEWIRKQLEDQHTGEELDRKILDVETKVLEHAQMLSDDKYYVEQYHIYMNLIWLNGEVGPGGGDVSGGTDFGPTETAVSLFTMLDRQLQEVKAEYEKLKAAELPRVNQSLAAKGLKPLSTTPPPVEPSPPGRRGQ